jgi:cell division protein FtsL
MKKILLSLIWTTFLALIAVNLYIFVSGIQIGAKMNGLEDKSVKLQKENLDLENNLVEIDSFEHASSIAAQLNFNQKAQAIYIENLPYALNR